MKLVSVWGVIGVIEVCILLQILSSLIGLLEDDLQKFSFGGKQMIFFEILQLWAISMLKFQELNNFKEQKLQN